MPANGTSHCITSSSTFPEEAQLQIDGDPLSQKGMNQVYPGNNLEYHLKPFRAAIGAGARQVMPSYARPLWTKYEEVAMAYNRGIVTDLLRQELGFD